MVSYKKAVVNLSKTLLPINRLVGERKNLKKENETLRIEKATLLDQLHNQDLKNFRSTLSNQFIKGNGIEVGALHQPLSVPSVAKVKYVDQFNNETLKRHYPELRDLDLVNVDIIDNGERLKEINNSSLDFIIANHFLEHCQDPIGTLIAFCKKLRKEGILYIAVPDKRYTFDKERALTSYSHLLEEHSIYPSKKYYRSHAFEMLMGTRKTKDRKELSAEVDQLEKMNYSIHYHVWTQKELMEFFYETAERFSLSIEVAAMVQNSEEIIFIIKKRA